MKNSTSCLLAIIATLLPPLSSALLVPNNKNGVGIKLPEVCFPKVAGIVQGGTVAPCVAIGMIETLCQPNNTESIGIEAHAQCMCNGSYFPDWTGCQNCLLVHGLRSERDNFYWSKVMSVASDALCTGTPTAILQSLFASATTNTDKAPFATSGDTTSWDQYPDNTAISLYYTTTITQGLGDITGTATSATSDINAAATKSAYSAAETESSESLEWATSGINTSSVHEHTDETGIVNSLSTFTHVITDVWVPPTTAIPEATYTSGYATVSTANTTTNERNAAVIPFRGSGFAMVVAGAVLIVAL